MFNKFFNNSKYHYQKINELYILLKKDYDESIESFNYIRSILEDKYTEDLDEIKIRLLDIEKTLDNKLYKTVANGDLDNQIKEVKNKYEQTFTAGFTNYLENSEIELDGQFLDDITMFKTNNPDKIISGGTLQKLQKEVNDTENKYHKNTYDQATLDFLKTKNFKDTFFKISFDYYICKYDKEILNKELEELNLFNSLLDNKNFEIIIDELNKEITNLKNVNEDLGFYLNIINEEKDLQILEDNIEEYQSFLNLLNNNQ